MSNNISPAFLKTKNNCHRSFKDIKYIQPPGQLWVPSYWTENAWNQCLKFMQLKPHWQVQKININHTSTLTVNFQFSYFPHLHTQSKFLHLPYFAYFIHNSGITFITLYYITYIPVYHQTLMKTEMMSLIHPSIFSAITAHIVFNAHTE